MTSVKDPKFINIMPIYLTFGKVAPATECGLVLPTKNPGSVTILNIYSCAMINDGHV